MNARVHTSRAGQDRTGQDRMGQDVLLGDVVCKSIGQTIMTVGVMGISPTCPLLSLLGRSLGEESASSNITPPSENP